MKKILLAVIAIIVIGFGVLVYTFLPQNLDVPAGEAAKLPSSTVPEGITLKAITSGVISSSAAFSYRGGSPLDERTTNVGSILVEHPKGALLFDAGFGASVDEHLKTAPWLMQKLVKLTPGKTVADQLKAAGKTLDSIKGVYITHAHWDHVSGLENLAGVPVFFPKAELHFIKNAGHASKLARDLIKDKYNLYDFQSGPYMGFEKSHDVYGDGSIVIVPMLGHTPGSIAAFVNTSDGKHYALIGDTAWQTEGVSLPAERPWMARNMVDVHTQRIRENLVTLHKIKKSNPDLIIVPAHDMRIWEKLPRLN
ncbi:MAG: MBL fold metallo-hydrolase [Methyloligellaceae bacterium]